ncbi:MAG TPA: bifunctional ADP-heptose synthase, partial [Terriglobia bacterium]|nr:bifunctional ADP-heptose synthase [Terriglobia bacterium]
MASKHSHLAKIIGSFRGRTIGVLGDYMVDELLRGEATRISPEAPVPVVLMKGAAAPEGFPGGAGNVAANIRALGGRPVPFGALGDDETGRRLRGLFKARGISTPTLVEERGRVTPRKLRIVAHQHQLLRLDFERAGPIASRTEEALARKISQWISRLEGMVISDYQKGSVTDKLAGLAISLGRQRRLPIFVDPKPENIGTCRHATLVTPNLHEAELIAGHSMRTRHDLEHFGFGLLSILDCSNLLITRGSEGMMLFESGGQIHDIPGQPRPVYDVTGSGDTVLAVLALAVTAGATLPDAARL